MTSIEECIDALSVIHTEGHYTGVLGDKREVKKKAYGLEFWKAI
jgi:hypothetical protein